MPLYRDWENWEKFITGDGLQNDGEVQPAFPYMSNRNFPLGSVADYLGVPIEKKSATLVRLQIKNAGVNMYAVPNTEFRL